MQKAHPDIMFTAEMAQVLSLNAYQIRDQIYNLTTPHPAHTRDDAASQQRLRLVRALADDLYVQLYIRPHSPQTHWINPFAQRDLVNALSDANCGSGGWDNGWSLRHRDAQNDHLEVHRDGVTFSAAGKYVRGPKAELQVGDVCRVWIGKEIRNLQRDYYIAIGNTDPGNVAKAPDALIRLYWHLTFEGAVPFIASVTKHLNAAKIPFRAKVLNAAENFYRADAGVLYLARKWYRRSDHALCTVYKDVRAHLRSDVPLFTRALDAGLSAAEDPENGLSFGEHRCRIAADALMRAYVDGASSANERAMVMIKAFREAEVQPERPYLKLRSRDRHGLYDSLYSLKRDNTNNIAHGNEG